MTEQEVRFFLDVVTDYFFQVTGEEAQVGIPYIKKQEPVVLAYTGLIGISGPRKGGIYFTATRPLLAQITDILVGMADPDDEAVLDMVGELTNTIAGNVRKSFGPEFQISVPMLVKGEPADISMQLKPPSFVIPLKWRQERAYLVVGLE